MVTLTQIKANAKAEGFNLDDKEFSICDWGIISKYFQSKNRPTTLRSLVRDLECEEPELMKLLGSQEQVEPEPEASEHEVQPPVVEQEPEQELTEDEILAQMMQEEQQNASI